MEVKTITILFLRQKKGASIGKLQLTKQQVGQDFKTSLEWSFEDR